MPLALGDVDRQAKIAYIEGSMKKHELWALYHLALINSGAAVRKEMLFNGRTLTNDEKVDRVFQTVAIHIDTFQECLDNRDSLIRGDI